MYADDHCPPHFHIRGPGWDVSVDLQTMEVMVGQGDDNIISEAIEWARRNQARLYTVWGQLNERE
jgi:hypothetical protein